jgi:hypothetical protein
MEDEQLHASDWFFATKDVAEDDLFDAIRA